MSQRSFNSTSQERPRFTAPRNREFLADVHETMRRARHIRPGRVRLLAMKLITPTDRRRILELHNGLRLYVDPLTHLGAVILDTGEYDESETEKACRTCVAPGDTVLDIGANEGYFSALLASLVGASGLVVAIEPQSRLCDLVEINIRLNSAASFAVYNNAFGSDVDGEQGSLHVWPEFNSGASSIVHPYRFGRRSEPFTFVSLDRILRETDRSHFDFAKIDVEGYEGRVVETLLPHLEAKRIRRFLIEYHPSLLRSHGFDELAIHASILRTGYRAVGESHVVGRHMMYQASG